MTSELAFIKLFLDRENYTLYRNALSGQELEKVVSDCLTGLDTWYRSNKEGDCTLEELNLLLMPVIDKPELDPLIKNLSGMTPSESAVEALRAFQRKNLYEALSVASYDASQGHPAAQRKLEDVLESLKGLEVEEEEEDMDELDPFDLSGILSGTDRSEGLQWRLEVFKKFLGNLLPGEFGFFIARPETGKTTMLASEVTHMMDQLKERDLGPCIWFNNEEPAKKVLGRLYQAALGKAEHDVRVNEGACAAMFKEKYFGYFRFVDTHDMTKGKVEAYIEKYRPRLIVIDQIDKITGFKADRDDIRLGEIYKWARGLCKQYELNVITVCQADGSGDGKQWLYMTNTADSKTAKQAEADWIVGIGKIHDSSFENIRYLNIVKNKLTGHHTKHEVLIKPEIGRYQDL